jgi:hypothetical protein
LSTLTPGTYVFRINTGGNSFLSSIFVKTAVGTVTAKYYDWGGGRDDEPASRYEVAAHPSHVSAEASRIVVSRIHDHLHLEVIVTSGDAQLGLYGTTVTDFPIAGNILDAQDGNLLADGGIPIVTYDDSDGKFYLLRGDQGALEVSFSAPDTPTIANVPMPTASTVYSYTFPDPTRRYIVQNAENGKIEVSLTSGFATKWTMFPGVPMSDEGIKVSGYTLYFRSSKANQELEIWSWA